MAMIEKSVERCTIELDPAEGTAVFKLHCYHGARRGAGADRRTRRDKRARTVLNVDPRRHPFSPTDPSCAGIVKTHRLYYEECELLQVGRRLPRAASPACASVCLPHPRTPRPRPFTRATTAPTCSLGRRTS